MPMLVVHSRKCQTERPFPSSLLVWDLSSGNRGMHCKELLAVERVLQQKQLRIGQACGEMAGAREQGREGVCSFWEQHCLLCKRSP